MSFRCRRLVICNLIQLHPYSLILRWFRSIPPHTWKFAHLFQREEISDLILIQAKANFKMCVQQNFFVVSIRICFRESGCCVESCIRQLQSNTRAYLNNNKYRSLTACGYRSHDRRRFDYPETRHIEATKASLNG